MVAESTDHVILLHRAALPTMARIERDRARVSNPRLQSLLSTMATHLFDPDFNVEVLKQRSQMADNNLSAMLNARLGVGLHAYIEARRIDTAEVLMRDTSLKLNTISALVGYTHPSVFSRAFLRARGERPSARRRRLRQQHLERDASAMPAPYALAPLRAPTCRATCADCSCPLDGASAMHVWRALEPLCPLCAQADPHMPRPLLTALALTPGAIVRRRLALPVRGVLPHPDPKRPQLPPAEHARLVEQLMICIDAIGGPAIDLWRQGGPVTPIARPGVAAPLATPTPFDDSPAIRGAAEAMCRRLYAWLAGRDLPSALAALTDDALPPAAAADSRPLRDALADVVAHRADRSTAQSPTAGHRRALEQIDAADDALLRLMLERARAVGQPAHVDRAAAFVERWIERAVTSGHPLAADRAQALRALAVVCRVEARVRCGEDDGAAATDLRLANADLLLSGSGNSDAPHHLDLAAQIAQLRAQCAFDGGAVFDARDHIDGLVDGLPGRALAGRRAEIRAQHAVMCLKLGDGGRAEALLDRAGDEPAPWEALDALRDVLAHNRAVAAYARGQDDVAWTRLTTLPPRAQDHVAALRLRGLLHLRAERAEDATASLIAALDRLADDVRPLEMAQVLTELGQIYVRFSRPHDFASHLGRVLEEPAVRRLLLADLEPRRARVPEAWARRQLDPLIAVLREGL